MAWREQWERVLRWHARWTHLTDGQPLDQPLDMAHLRDDMLAFFQNAHHLKDWLGNDPASGKSHAEVEAIVRSSDNLKRCADLCNGAKHFTLLTDQSGRLGRTGLEPRMGVGNIAVNFTDDETAGIWLTSQDIELNDGTVIDAMQLADEVIAEWERTLTEWGLLPRGSSGPAGPETA
jgi:hypothetical protein